VKTIRNVIVDKLTLRLVEKNGIFVGLIFGPGAKTVQIEGDVAEDVWRRLHNEAAKANPKYFGFDGARARFLHFFPGGFHSDGYVGRERAYKVAAKAKLDAAVPVEKAATGSDYGEAVLSVFQATNLLYPVEKTRLQSLLRGKHADAFVRAAAQFTLGETKSGLSQMQHVLKPHDNAKWTVVTYLPFLWRPEEHMFLKPEVTKDFASRVGHRFASDYEPQLDIAVYVSLLDLARETTDQLVELKPRDRIDVQSFIWVVGDYVDENQEPLP
jgi:hypothetical protein